MWCNFFLGSGQIYQDQYYFYYTNTDKGIQLNKVNAESKYLFIRYCSDDEKPRIEKEVKISKTDYVLKKETQLLEI